MTDGILIANLFVLSIMKFDETIDKAEADDIQDSIF